MLTYKPVDIVNRLVYAFVETIGLNYLGILIFIRIFWKIIV